jgi:ribosomal protein S18
MSEEKVIAPASAIEADKVVTAKTVASITTADKPVATKPSRLDETKARNKKALADALAKARAVKIARPPEAPAVLAAKAGKPAKISKLKLVRHKVTMPEIEYAQIAILKKRIASLGGNVKRSELMRGGLSLLAALGDAELALVMTAFGRLKSKRPVKKA